MVKHSSTGVQGEVEPLAVVRESGPLAVAAGSWTFFEGKVSFLLSVLGKL